MSNAADFGQHCSSHSLSLAAHLLHLVCMSVSVWVVQLQVIAAFWACLYVLKSASAYVTRQGKSWHRESIMLQPIDHILQSCCSKKIGRVVHVSIKQCFRQSHCYGVLHLSIGQHHCDAETESPQCMTQSCTTHDMTTYLNQKPGKELE